MNSVSVVITTVNRPKVLNRALLSVKNQTHKDIEIIVVVDGASEETLFFLEKNFPECNVIAPNIKVGGSEARNLGIRKASKKYIALLDDDDEWLPNKLEIQIAALKNTRNKNVCCFSSFFTYYNNPRKSYKFPKKAYREGNLGDYIFGSSFGFRTGAIQTSTIIAPKQVMLDVPFIKNLPKHQDWSWALDAYKNNVEFIHINDPLSIYHKDMNSRGVSKKTIWEFSKKWIYNRKNDISEGSFFNFMFFVVQNGISKDHSKTRATRLRLIRDLHKEIPLSRKFSFIALRYNLQSLYQIVKFGKK